MGTGFRGPSMVERESRWAHRWRQLAGSRTARTAIAYAAGGWLLVQLAESLLAPFGLTDLHMRLLIIALVAGFAVAVAGAAVLDLRASRRAQSPAADALPAPAAPAPAGAPSVAVLAFADMSAARDQGWFCEGAAEEIINTLAGVRGLRVASRAASFRFRDGSADHREIARLLDVRAVLDGSVRKAGDQLRVSAQLVDAADGSVLWSQTFDRKPENILAIQEEIAGATLRALRVALIGADAARVRRREVGDLQAYEFYLRGQQLMRREKTDEARAAVQLFREAVRRDPAFAEAHAALSGAIAYLLARVGDPSQSLDDARAAGRRALELAPTLAEAHVANAKVLALDGRFDDAAAAFREAIAHEPRNFDAHYFYARFLVTRGDHAAAVRHYETAFEVRPDDFLPVTMAIQEYQALGDKAGEKSAIARSWAAIERRLAVDPDDSAAYDHGSGVLTLLGRPEDARRFLDKALALRPDDPATHYNAACTAALAGDTERAVDLLERAIALGWVNTQWLMRDNDLVPLHDHPRFKQLVAKLA